MAGLSEWVDWEAVATNLPDHDAELLLDWARYIHWRVKNHKELVKEWFLEGNDDMARIAADPENMLVSMILGVLLAAYRLGEGKTVDDSNFDVYKDFIASLPAE